MAIYNSFQGFLEHIANGVHKFNTDTFKIALTNTAPVANQISFTPGSLHQPPVNANGYPTGGGEVTISSLKSNGVLTIQGTQLIFTATSGGIGPFRYAVLYNDTQTSPADPLIAWWDYGSSVTLNEDETITIRFNEESPGTIFTITQ